MIHTRGQKKAWDALFSISLVFDALIILKNNKSRNVFKIDYCHDNQDPWHGNETSGLTFVYGICIFMVDRRRNLPEPWQATSKLVENSAAPSC